MTPYDIKGLHPLTAEKIGRTEHQEHQNDDFGVELQFAHLENNSRMGLSPWRAVRCM